MDFEWALTRQDLVGLQGAVFEWGSGVVGRYKCFDARMLQAINAALGETNSIFVLKEPKNFTSLDCNVSCTPDGDGFRIQGHALFDIVFGYGEAGIQDTGPGRTFLGPDLRAALVATVGALGWDLERLQAPRVYAPYEA